MIDWPKILCWCEESIPPFACFWMKEVMNPVATQEPIVVVGRPTGDIEFSAEDTETLIPAGLGLLTKTWDTVYLYYSNAIYVINLRPECLTNGSVFVPAKTVFCATQVMRGPHWMGYDDAQAIADPEHTFFYPRKDSWMLGSLQSDYQRLRGAAFRRIGAADTVNKCVPVLMVSTYIAGDAS